MNTESKLFGFELSKQWDYENGFYITSDITRISKLVAHWDIYKKIVDLPGEVVECGVYKGASLLRFATFREILESPYSRKIIGFDAFGAFPKSGDKDDLKFIDRFEADGGDGISKPELEKVLKMKGFRNIDLVEGNVETTISSYIETHPALRISLLHIDVDVYHPTKIILEQLYSRVVKGGVIVFDDYAKVAGETIAVEEYFGKDAKFKKMPYTHVPSFYIKE